MKAPVCKLPTPSTGDPPVEACGTAKGLKLCVGDRVERRPIKSGGKTIRFKHKGIVMGVQLGRTNDGKKALAARVCFDNDEPGDLAYRYLFSELKPLK